MSLVGRLEIKIEKLSVVIKVLSLDKIVLEDSGNTVLQMWRRNRL